MDDRYSLTDWYTRNLLSSMHIDTTHKNHKYFSYFHTINKSLQIAMKYLLKLKFHQHYTNKAATIKTWKKLTLIKWTTVSASITWMCMLYVASHISVFPVHGTSPSLTLLQAELSTMCNSVVEEWYHSLHYLIVNPSCHPLSTHCSWTTYKCNNLSHLHS